MEQEQEKQPTNEQALPPDNAETQPQGQAKPPKKPKQPQPELDMETTVADMNVEGFSWYNPNKKKGKDNGLGDISKKEYWAMVKGAYAAFLPILLCILAVGILGFFLIKWWLS